MTSSFELEGLHIQGTDPFDDWWEELQEDDVDECLEDDYSEDDFE